MGRPYHLDLRERVIAEIKGGMSKIKASKTFKICRQTVYDWIALEKEQGHLEAKSGYQNGHSQGIVDLEGFKKYVQAHPDQTQEEMAAAFSVGSSTISRTLQKIHYTRKKRVTPIQNVVKKKGVNLKRS